VEALVSVQGNPSGAARGYAAWDVKLLAVRPEAMATDEQR
jgi:hypothetical protein